ncbi:RsmF rRNA methyltransferase first C-terminal domain-containing protein [Lapidilactobacillus gannanensis]|uniref:RsmF rRNA methyltransferase first C-terminal domain-containing protein n=1 Tax=Lapidilactobacillus gannanensis TaxID=2486002 RepID=A0ABW4BQ53_9LACO|nr:RsmB/NOP family class I SAM-dependent RNA methyltransferase [Lapidilactobacillus gannanensis]
MKLPQDFQTKYQTLLGAESTAFLASLQEPAVKGFRLNPKKIAAQPELQQRFQQNYSAIPWSHWGFYGQVPGDDIAQLAGDLYSQEPSAQAVAALANPAANSRVLDLCAAPGGKTTQLASILNETGLLVANEIDRQRAKVLSENVERFGYSNTVVTNYAPDQLAQLLPHFFDVIVVDAPCSGEGMFRKDPQAIDYWSAAYPKQCQQRQRQILLSALALLAPNGTLVYSTCTFAPEEDEENIDWLLQQAPNFEVVAPTGSGWELAAAGRPEWGHQNPQLSKTVRFWPQSVRGEGHFMAKLVAKSAVTNTHNTRQETAEIVRGKQRPNHHKGRSTTGPTSAQLAQWQAFQQATLKQLPAGLTTATIVSRKEQLFAMPTALLVQPQLRFVRRGLWLGAGLKNRFVPNHALLMSLPRSAFKNVIDLTESDYQHYRHGETLSFPEMAGKGWYAVCYQQQPFSWGYLTNHTLKNFYPKNFRR